nr:MAG: hypothetical protein [Bacteriophage sp.]
MSEEKLYAVKDDEGKYLDMDPAPWWDGQVGTAEVKDLANSPMK